jgi:hypothetical protein
MRLDDFFTFFIASELTSRLFTLFAPNFCIAYVYLSIPHPASKVSLPRMAFSGFNLVNDKNSPTQRSLYSISLLGRVFPLIVKLSLLT